MFAEQVPAILGTADQFQQWLAANLGAAEIKRTIGEHRFHIGDAEGMRKIYSYVLWIWQRATDCCASLESADKAFVDAWFSDIDTLGALGRALPPPVRRDHNKPVPAR